MISYLTIFSLTEQDIHLVFPISVPCREVPRKTKNIILKFGPGGLENADVIRWSLNADSC